MGYLQDARTGNFDYVVIFQQTPGGTTVQESRQPKRGSRLLTAFTQDIGLPEMALMFLPELQDDYEISCEGTTEWNGQRTLVVHFIPHKDKPGRTLSFRDSKGKTYPARLKGRAWIAADSGEVLHMETSLMEEIPGTKVRHWYIKAKGKRIEWSCCLPFCCRPCGSTVDMRNQSNGSFPGKTLISRSATTTSSGSFTMRSAAPELPRRSRPIPFVTASQPICWSRAPIYAPSRSCWGIAA